MSQTDAMLLEHWRRERNAEAFRMLATRYAGMVYHTCRRILNNPTDAEDAAQECFLTLAASSKPVGGYLAPWLHRVACNQALARLRAEQRRRDRETRYAAALDTPAESAWNDLQEHIDEAIAALPEKLRAPVVAYFLDGLSQDAVAQALAIPRSTVTHRIDRGVECLRKTLQAKGLSAVAGAAFVGVIKANTAAAAAPASLVAGLGKLALSGAGPAAVPVLGAAATGFFGAKTVVAALAGLAVVAFAGWKVVEKGEAAQPLQTSSPVARSGQPAPIPPVQPPLPGPAKGLAAVAAPSPAAGQDQSPTPPLPAPQVPAPPPPPRRFPSLGDVGSTVVGAWQNLRRELNGENDRRSTCQNNLKQFGLVFKMFAQSAPGQYYPMLRTEPGPMMFANTFPGLPPVAPELLTDKRILVCPSDGTNVALLEKPRVELLDHSSYYYLGYAVTTIEQLEAFVTAFRERRGTGLAYDEDLNTPQGKVLRLREGVERFFITDLNNPAAAAMTQSNIPVMIEELHHDPTGGNILFLDGHVEFRRYAPNGEFPMNERTLKLLRSLGAIKGAGTP